MSARTSQRQMHVKSGSYFCQKCQTEFEFNSDDPAQLQCPNCATKVAENLVSTYTEAEPEKDEMLSADEFGPGD